MLANQEEQVQADAVLEELRSTTVRLQAAIDKFLLRPQHATIEHKNAAQSAEADLKAGDLKRILQIRARRRRKAFGQFLDWPAWDMLLDLAAVKAEGGHVSVSAICISSGAPQSTALRKLASLESAGMVRRYLHGPDRRRVCLELTDNARLLVKAMLTEDAEFYLDIANER